ncbi:MAG TPA: phosphoglycerate kinase [Polyangiaceae bacterium]|nr:phosphoglycerate kinase [Polyangiaceae bacterium]
MNLLDTDHLSSLEKLDIEGQRVLVRLDFEVAEQQPEALTLQVERALPTLHHLLAKRARIIVASHATGHAGEALPSMEAAGAVLAEKLNCDVLLPDDVVGDMARKITGELRTGQLAILENLAREPGELNNDLAFAQQLAALCDAFVNEAPSLFDRKLASTVHLPRRVQARALGLDSVRVAQGLRTLQLHREQLIAVIALSEVTRETLAQLQVWLPRVRGLIVVSQADSVLEALRPPGKRSASSELPDELLSRCQTLHEQARASSKKLLAIQGAQLASALEQVTAAGSPTPLALVGSLTSAQVSLDALPSLLAGRPLVGAFGIPVLLSLHSQPALLAQVPLACASEQVALRALSGEALPSLAALTGVG